MSMIFSAGPRDHKAVPPDSYVLTKHGSYDWKRKVVAFEGKCIVTAPAEDFFADTEKSKPYMSKVLDSPTWGQLFACSKAQQKRTLDFHHAFFEGYYVSGTIDTPDGLITTLTLSLGS
jgi:hypothetical protein